MNFDYQGAKEAGYSDEEINEYIGREKKSQPKYEKMPGTVWGNIKANMGNFLGNLGSPVEEEEQEEGIRINPKILKKFPDFDYEGAIQSGYSPEEVEDYLEEQKPKRSKLEKGARIATQIGLGMAEASPLVLPYDISASVLGSKDAQNAAYRQTISEDIERLQEQKEMGQWDEQDQGLYDHLVKQLQDPSESEKFTQTANLTSQGLLEKLTGVDLAPEGVVEKGARWLGFLKDPKKGFDALKGVTKNPKELLKALIPGEKAVRAGLAGTALEMAEDGQFGPMGTLGAAIAGDLTGMGVAGLARSAMNPKKTIAEITNLLTRGNSKNEWTKQIIEDAKNAGVQLDAGTLTNSNLVRMAQARASQSALSGTALDNFRKDLSNQIVNGYKNIADTIGALTFENNYQAAEAIKNALKVEEGAFPAFKDFKKPARSLEGRVAVQERPLYQQEFLNRISPNEFASDYVAGETLQTVAQDIKQPLKETFNRRWTAFNNEIREVASTQGELASQLRRFVAENEGSLLLGESAAEARVMRSVQTLLGELLEGENALRSVSVSDLVKTKRTLADITNWEIGKSDFSSRFKEIVGNIDEAINRTLTAENPMLSEIFQELNAEYSAFKNTFENKNVVSLFEPRNQNYNHLYDQFISNPDKLRSLEDMLMFDPRGEQVLNQVKRDAAQRITSRRDITPREINNLSQMIGPQFAEDVQNFNRLRLQDLEHPLPQPTPRQRLGVNAEIAPSTGGAPIKQGRVKESEMFKRKKFYEYLKDKSSEQIMKQMDTVSGIKRLKANLSLTPEGRELFKELSRFKLEEMIGNKMKDGMTEQVKLGTFQSLLKTSKEKAIIKELVGQKSYDRLRLLQKNANVLQDSMAKFYNASKSGTTLTDVGLVSTGIVGILTGNPFAIGTAFGSALGMRIASNLLSDPEFLRLLQEAVLSNKKEKFVAIMGKMKPKISQAVKASSRKSLDMMNAKEDENPQNPNL